MKSFLIIVLLLAVVAAERIVVKVDGCNFRAAPICGTNRAPAVVARGVEGEVLDVIGDYADWRQVRVGSNQEGFITAAAISESNIVIGQGAALRSMPTAKGNAPLAFIKAGTRVVIINRCVSWYRTAKGWIYAENAEIK